VVKSEVFDDGLVGARLTAASTTPNQAIPPSGAPPSQQRFGTVSLADFQFVQRSCKFLLKDNNKTSLDQKFLIILGLLEQLRAAT
jgi:hypothetical protein